MSSSCEKSCGQDCQQICLHQQTMNMDGISVCISCGIQLEEELLEEQYYFGGNKGVPRHNNRKESERSLYSDLEIRGFPQKIIERADEYYKKIIENKIYRSKNRIAIVFACVFYAYIDYDQPQSAQELAKKFSLDRKGTSSGFKSFAQVFRNNREKRHIDAMDLIPKILSDLGIQDQKVYVEDLYKIYNHSIRNSISIRTAIPQSVAAGMVYYYLKLKDFPINKTDYSKIVKLTEITFIKVANDFAEVIGKSVKL